MKATVLCTSIAIALAGALIAQPSNGAAGGQHSPLTLYGTGLNNPRGLAFGPDGSLYIAEAGNGTETTSTQGECTQVQAPVGPYLGGYGGRVTRIDSNRNNSTVVDGLPSSAIAAGFALGPQAIAFAGNHMYVLDAGGGCSHGVDGDPAGILEILPGGGWDLTADLSAYIQAHPGPKPITDPDYEPDGTFYGMVFRGGRLYTAEPNHGQFVSVDRKGNVSLVADLFSAVGDHTPASITYNDGWFYIGFEGQIPGFVAGIWRVSVNGQHIEHVNSTLSSVLGLTFGTDGTLYAVSSTDGTAPPFFIGNRGKLVRVESDGSFTVLAGGLNFPSSLITGPDGALYLSNCGYGCAPGEGQVLRYAPK